MPWNQPLKTKQHIKRSPKISRLKYFGFIIGSILIVVLSLLLFERDEPTQIENRKVTKKSYAKAKADLIAKVEAKTKKRFNTVKQSVKPSGPVDLGYGFYTNRAGEVKARTRPAFVIRPRQSRELFTQPAENFISAIVNTKGKFLQITEYIKKSRRTDKIFILMLFYTLTHARQVLRTIWNCPQTMARCVTLSIVSSARMFINS